MTLEQFIAEKESKGFTLKNNGDLTFLSAPMETFQLHADGAISYSSPAGNRKWRSVDDYTNNITEYSEDYSIRD